MIVKNRYKKMPSLESFDILHIYVYNYVCGLPSVNRSIIPIEKVVYFVWKCDVGELYLQSFRYL